jgi:predicted  nucleic acid-binding Zn-ribbon protein
MAKLKFKRIKNAHKIALLEDRIAGLERRIERDEDFLTAAVASLQERVQELEKQNGDLWEQQQKTLLLITLG